MIMRLFPTCKAALSTLSLQEGKKPGWWTGSSNPTILEWPKVSPSVTPQLSVLIQDAANARGFVVFLECWPQDLSLGHKEEKRMSLVYSGLEAGVDFFREGLCTVCVCGSH